MVGRKSTFGLSQVRNRCPTSLFETNAISFEEDRCKAAWGMQFRITWREASPPTHHNDIVDSDQLVVKKELSLSLPLPFRRSTRLSTTLLSNSTCLTQSSLGPYVVQLWSGYFFKIEPKKAASSTVWLTRPFCLGNPPWQTFHKIGFAVWRSGSRGLPSRERFFY